ncbi:related to Oxidoreductase, short-chain dehydrogenase [Serendipita indica DSM 11827]|uniref:Related to Oxidoreductase, short-chain dehydrogenase n=1 Tax=Serendipita indica (strain DSM 11827) TaxID=1109443 RepID=G4TYG1_SERID|nr:related to Oxidoreductase, short-chain dehydrogenase [Serendipita indica DSM 11827]
MPRSIRWDGVCKLLAEFAPGTPQWKVEDIPDLTGKVAIVTGGNAGIGYEIVKALLTKHAKVYLTSRSTTNGEVAVRKLRDEVKDADVHVLEINLADMSSVKRAASAFQSKETQLHLLINNAGVMSPPVDHVTAQGYDLQFGTNVLGHYYFTHLLLPTLKSTSSSIPATDPIGVRIVELASDAHLLSAFTGGEVIKLETLKDGDARRAVGTTQLYMQSKSGNILVAAARARKMTELGINIFTASANPGRIESNLQRHAPAMGQILSKPMLYPTKMGALTPLYVATSPEALKHNGKYFAPWARRKEPRIDHENNIEVEDKLIGWLEEQTSSFESNNDIS